MGNKPNMTSSALADNDKKDIYKLQVVECPPTPGVLLASNHVVSSLLERVDFDNVKRSLLFGGRQQRVSQKLHDMIGG